MRFYDIRIFKPGTKTVLREYTSYPGNQPDPGALNVILDAHVSPFASPAAHQGAVIQIWGISLEDLGQTNNFTNCPVEVYAGFQRGLPLNNPAQAGLIFAGTIFQSFANWQGTDMTLDFVVFGSGAIAAQNANIVLNWKAGTTLATALSTTLSNAFPGLKQNIKISQTLVLGHDETGVYQSLPAFAQMLKPLTQAAIGGHYPGVDIVLTPNEIRIFDGSTQSNPVQIAFQDLIGQPTWINQQTIQFVCPMRADLTVSDYIMLPKGILGNPANPAGAPGAVTTTSASQPQARQQSIFSGVFIIVAVHQMGEFRQADGTAWVTVFDAVNQLPPPLPAGNVTFDVLSITQ